jgi:DNA processing protein
MLAPASAKIPADAVPRSEAARLDWLRLARSRRVGPATFVRLIREYGSAPAALEALPAIAAAAGAGGYAPASRAAALEEWEAAAAAGARPLLLGAADYPALLATIADPPPLLWALGDPALAERPVVALVGARNASALGCRMAARLAAELGEMGFVVGSGLARGIDAAAHRAALVTGTVAAQAGGVDDVYPPENAALADEIARCGLRLSEMPMGHAPRAQDFPRRNRIVSGLALGVVVVEGATRSGSLITARNALDQGREVMAVPGNPMDARAGGCNQLIRDGAVLVRSAADIAEALAEILGAPPAARRPEAVPPAPPTAADPVEARLLALLGPSPVAEDCLIRDLALPAAAVAAALLGLELAGRVLRHPGGFVSLAA